MFFLIAAVLILIHLPLLRLPYFWDEAGYYIPAARDLLAGSLIPHSTPSNAHPPLVMAWIALSWKLFGESPLVTRCAMLLLAAFSLLGFFRLARTVSNNTVALSSTILLAIYPVFFTQSSLAQIDLPAAGLIFWALDYYFRANSNFVEGARASSPVLIWSSIIFFSLAALAKETAILVPIALLIAALVRKSKAVERLKLDSRSFLLALSGVPLGIWYAYHYARTGRVFGNPEFFRYNVQSTLHPLRVLLAFFLRLWQTFGYLDLYVLTIACIAAMMFRPLTDKNGERTRIAPPVQFTFLWIVVVYLIALSLIGGAVLARYMLPVVPLIILVCVSTIWRRLPAWKPILGVVGLAFISALFINPPYGFSIEDNLAYRDYIRLHERAEAFLEQRFPNAHVLTAWPASDELTRPYLGYVRKPMLVIRIDDFSAEQILSATDVRSGFDVALVFSTKYQPHSIFDRWYLWQEWKTRYFDFHVDITPEAASSILGGDLIYVQRLRGQWIGIIELRRIEEARLQ